MYYGKIKLSTWKNLKKDYPKLEINDLIHMFNPYFYAFVNESESLQLLNIKLTSKPKVYHDPLFLLKRGYMELDDNFIEIDVGPEIQKYRHRLNELLTASELEYTFKVDIPNAYQYYKYQLTDEYIIFEMTEDIYNATYNYITETLYDQLPDPTLDTIVRDYNQEEFLLKQFSTNIQ